MRWRVLLLMALVTVSAPALAAPQAELTEEQAAEAMDFAMHDAVFTLYHETGHLLVHELDLPVLGKEEDAADALAVITILKTIKDEDERYWTLNDVADGWYYSAEQTTGQGIDDLAYYDDHSLDIQRSYAVVCMMVGANKQAFADTADVYNLDADQQDDCQGTYQQADRAWKTVLSPFYADKPGRKIPVTYADPGSYAQFADELKSRKILESLADYLRTTFRLPGPVSIRAEQCGEANAYYDEDTHEITYCYELPAEMYRLDVDKNFGSEADLAGNAQPSNAQPVAEQSTNVQSPHSLGN